MLSFSTHPVRRFLLAGYSLIETMVVLAVVAVMAAVAAPSLAQMVSNPPGRGAAELLREDLVFARSEAVSRRANVFLLVSRGANWCYAVSADPACGCTGTCANPAQIIKVVRGSEFKGVSLTAASFAGSQCGTTKCVRFEPNHGTATGSNGTVVFESGSGASYKVIVAPLGRVRTCSNGGDAASGMPDC